MESRKNSKYFPSPPNGLLAWAFTVTLPFRSNDLNSYLFPNRITADPPSGLRVKEPMAIIYEP